MSAFAPVSTSFFGLKNFIQRRPTCVSEQQLANRTVRYHSVSRQTPSAVWVKQSASILVEADPGYAYDVYSNIQEMPNWSPWLQEVRIDPRDGMLSTWVLKAQGIEIAWKARVTDSTRGERIAWHSLSGLKNRGSVQFARVAPEEETNRGNSAQNSSSVTLAIEFDVPDFLARAFDNNFIGKFVRERLSADLKRYRMVVLRKKRIQRLEEQRNAA